MELLAHLRMFRENQSSGYTASAAAHAFVEMMEAKHPQVLDEWLRAKAVRLVNDALRQLDVNQRHETKRGVARRAFADAAVLFRQDRNAEHVRLFQMPLIADAFAHRKALKDMTGAECLYAATSYEARAEPLLAMGAFLRALGAKAGRKTIESVMSEDDCERLLASFLAPDQMLIEAA